MSLDLIDELEALVAAISAGGIDYAVCGGLALGIHGHPRMTKDIDLLVREEDVEPVLEIAKLRGFDIPARGMTFGLRTGTPRVVHRVSKLDPETGRLMPLDLLVVNPELAQVWSERELYKRRSSEIHVVSRAGLITMKRIAARPQDLVDISKLEGSDDDSEA